MRLKAAFVIVTAILSGHFSASALAARVEEAGYVGIGGIEQWITLRGDDSQPLLLLLHGGPGDVQSPFISTYSPYEDAFLLVQWDQRGAGRTFAASGSAGLTLEQQIADGIELSELLHERFPGQQLLLLAHSWGSIIATGMVQRRPDLFDAYIGTGQVAAWADTVSYQFNFLKRQYTETGDAAALAQLEAIGTPDPTNIGQYFAFSGPLRQFMNVSDKNWLAGIDELVVANGGTDATLKAASDGMNASGAALISRMVTIDLPASATRFELPYYVIQGRHDISAPTPLAESYFARVTAPSRGMVIIEDAGHFAVATHPHEVISAIREMRR